MNQRRAEILDRLRKLADLSKEDPERYHDEADQLLLECVDGELGAEIRQAYRALERWFA